MVVVVEEEERRGGKKLVITTTSRARRVDFVPDQHVDAIEQVYQSAFSATYG